MQGKYRTTPTPLADGEVAMPLLDSTGALAVSGALTNAQMQATLGAANTAAWDGVAPSATMLAVLKAIHAQNAQMIVHLAAIAANTTA